MKFFLLLPMTGALVASLAGLLIPEQARAFDNPPPGIKSRVEFNRDIRPILSDTCFHCHGPDKAKRKAELRLDTEAGAKADLGGRKALVPSDVAASELYQRLIADDPAERMPPPKTGKSLSAAQIELIRRWIEQGADWQPHWSFISPVRSAEPAVQQTGWIRNPIDAFVLARLERDGLHPSPEADRTTLIRRATFDLTGLPPTPAEVDAFIADKSSDAFEQVIDRLLASPRYGERMAVRWLDGARYADTSGYQTDGERFMWRWRDWVIEAYNRNLPFDQFTIEQLAGDMLAAATLDQQIASGFNRNHRSNSEGGIIPEEYAVEYVVDRVETTSTVWMGLTMGCSRCHDHKFDPLAQLDFYRMYAYFNNIPEFGRALKYGNSPPMISAPTTEQRHKLRQIDNRLVAAECDLAGVSRDIVIAQSEWARSVNPETVADWSIADGLQVHLPLDGNLRMGEKPDAPVANVEHGESAFGSGRLGQAADFDGTRFINAGDVGSIGFLDKFTFAAWIFPRGPAGGTILSRMADVPQGIGYSLLIDRGRLQLNLVVRWLDDALRVETEQTLSPDTWHHVLVTYDGSRAAAGVTFYVDGQVAKKNVLFDFLTQPFNQKEPLRIGGGHGDAGRFHGLIDDVRIYNRPLTESEAKISSVPEAVGELVKAPRFGDATPQGLKIRRCFLERGSSEQIRKVYERTVESRRERDRYLETIPTTMVMHELPVPRPTHVLIRGEYNKPGDQVTVGVPECLPPLPSDLPKNRLGFARWLVSPQHPLTSRVAVNRLWQMLFGTGIVKTIDDFGAQGDWPSHPELLDWLAVEFATPAAPVDGKDAKAIPWDTKRLLRLLMTSATYRQSSKITPELLQRDPENRLLTRGPRLRLSAEMVRDQALFASGLLVEKQGGPSVKPYQPEGLWKELTDTEYVQDKGDNLYRRSMYTFWKRTVAPPTMITFDAAGRETCIVRETRTNTPLQALTLMNDVTFVEASRALAERVMHETGKSPTERLTLGFRLAVSRPPKPAELSVLLSGWQSQHVRFTKDAAAAEKLISQGERPRDTTLNVAELAAYTTLAGVILNLDETITKE